MLCHRKRREEKGHGKRRGDKGRVLRRGEGRGWRARGKEWCTFSRGDLFVGVSHMCILKTVRKERHSNNCWCCYVAACSRSLCITSANHSSIVSVGVDWSTKKLLGRPQ